MKDTFDILLLLALPASGKSEIRTFIKGFPKDVCARDFHLGPSVQLDDFPYVHLMRRIDEELLALGHDCLFFQAPDRPFRDPWDWGTLIELLNEDYEDLEARRVPRVESCAELLFERLDRAAKKAGARPKLMTLDEEVRAKVALAIEGEARRQVEERIREYPESLEGHTVVIEFARGGPDGASMPLPPPFGYAHSLSLLSPNILEKAAILYVWVTPEESRRKNAERADPKDPGSILHHGVPLPVMLGDYGCDDMAYLIETSQRPGTIRVVTKEGRAFDVPVVRLDNRVDKTSFVRRPRSEWKDEEVERLKSALVEACGKLYEIGREVWGG